MLALSHINDDYYNDSRLADRLLSRRTVNMIWDTQRQIYVDHQGLFQIVVNSVNRTVSAFSDALVRWANRAKNAVKYRPGGAGYLEARRDFMVRAGQSRATRRYNPY